MARNKGTFPFAANFEVKAASPLDPRVLVERKSELISKDTWPLDGDTLYIYKGLLVSVQEERAIYMLVDPDKILETDYSGWERKDGSSPGAVSYEDIYIIEGLTAQDIESYVEGPLRMDGRNLSEAIDSNKRVYIKYSNSAGAGIIPCSAYREDVYYVSFRLNSLLYGFDFGADSIHIDETSMFYIDIQEKLESGKNIKTINGQSILGRGEITIEGLPSATPDWNENNPSDASYIKNRTHYKVENIIYGTSTSYGDHLYDDNDIPIVPRRIRVRSEEGFVSDWINVYDGYSEYFEELYLYDEYGDIQDTYAGTISVDMITSGVELNMGGSSYYVDLDYSTIKQLDEEFIPDTIARKSDIVGDDSGVQARLDEIDIEINDLYNTKIDKENDDYYPQMSVGTADNLSGVDVVASEFTSRQSGGGAILDGTARIEAIKGNSIVWNQLLDINNFGTKTVNGITATASGDESIVVSGSTTDNESWIVIGHIYKTIGNKYLLTGCPSGGSRNTYSLIDGSGSVQGLVDKGDGVIAECTLVEGTGKLATIQIVVRRNVSIDNLVFTPRLYDLTKMFGAGNEPTTVDEFYARMPIEINTSLYNEGQMINLNPSGIKSYSADEEPIERFQDLSIVGGLFPDGMKSAGEFHDEIRYNKDTQKWEKITCIGELSLDDERLSWSITDEPSQYFFSNAQDFLYKDHEVISLNSSDFTPLVWSNSQNSFNQNYNNNRIDAIALWKNDTGNCRLNICCDACQDIDALKEYLKGKKIYYALNEPIVEVLDEEFGLNNGFNVDFNLDYEVWNGGIEELVADNPSSALKADIVYGFNAYGKIKELENKIDNLGTGGGGTGGSSITVDSALSDTSTNPVQNKVITEALSTKLESEVVASSSPTEEIPLGYDDTKIWAEVSKKQDTITDLETIRSGAEKGATAIQEVKTINGQSIVGEGDITIQGGGGGASNEWKCVVDRMMVEGEQVLTFETFADGTPLNAKELIVQVEIVEKSDRVVNGYVRVQSTNNKNLSYYGPINYTNNVSTGVLEYIHMQASPFYMVADMGKSEYNVGTTGQIKVSGGGLTDRFEVYENFVMVQLYPNSTIDTPPYIKIYAR